MTIKSMTGNQVRRTFLEYFEKKGHQIVRSSSLVPQDDPTLLFVNAGMVQFKRAFLGDEKRPYVRATTSQKCVRAGGKHNDLENVGYTARHHTFFEMLGNFSFGDYFKEKAIAYAWDLLTNGYGLPADKLWVSIYLDDDEAGDIWQRQVGVPAERIRRFGEEDNFWAMGDTGPCGPCSEIHIDRGREHGCGRPECTLGCECDRFLEIWNLVFMQFNRDASGKMTPLPKPSIDTGLGLERMASIVQDVPTNFDTDLFTPIMRRTGELSGMQPGQSAAADVAMKVIADHSRAAAFLIGDGILPSNEGRGYVLRRIMRRAIRYGRNIGLQKPFLHETASVVFDVMKPAYPELYDSRAFITSVIKNEEVRFSETLDFGLKVLNDALADLRAEEKSHVPGDLIFKLYDTYGFPVDIVRDVVRDEGMTLDMDGFEHAMEGQRERSRTVSTFTAAAEAYRKLSSAGQQTAFTGYGELETEAEVLTLVHDGRELSQAREGDVVEMVTDVTPFYAESGGQVGDRGVASGRSGRLQIEDTVKDPTGLVIHRGRVVEGVIRPGEKVRLSVDNELRAATARNHTATHILHWALREVVGDHVKQAGSLVAPDRLRFDFTHFSQVNENDLAHIETLVNARIRENVPVSVQEMDMDEALKTGATALFEEKYGDRVRVISLERFSRELCGGTHTRRTGDIGLFRIVSESGVAAGIRRIEALTGAEAVRHVQQTARLLNRTAHLLREAPAAVPERIEKILAAGKVLERQVEELRARIAAQSLQDVESSIRDIGGMRVLVQKVSAETPAALRELGDRLKEKIGSGVVVLGSEAGGKALLIALVTKDLVKRCHAGRIVKEVAAVVGGGGGGRPDMAQAGGTRPQALDEALEKAYKVVAETCGK